MYKLLIVDDEPLTRSYFKLNISKLSSKWEVAGEASDGEEALEFIKNNEVDLVITDIKMPVMDGMELCRQISEIYPNLRLVILSGYDEFSFAKRALAYGVKDYLLKPIVFKEVHNILEKISEEIQQEKQKEFDHFKLLQFNDQNKNYIVKDFLQAIISGSNTEIKSLYRRVKEIAIDLSASQHLIAVLSIDSKMFLSESAVLSHIDTYKDSINSIADEFFSNTGLGWAFFDSNGNTILYIYENETSYLPDKCKTICTRLYEQIYSCTGITICSGIGSTVEDIFHLSQSYEQALLSQSAGLKLGSTFLYCYDELITSSSNIRFMNKISKATNSIISYLINNDKSSYNLAVSNALHLIKLDNTDAIYRFYLYVINQAARIISSGSGSFIDASIKQLEIVSNSPKVPVLKELIQDLFSSIKINFDKLESGVLLSPNLDNSLENENLIDKAKEYIYLNYSEAISLSDLANNLKVSSSYLSHLFHKSVGESYIKFLTRVRMEKAALLLKSSAGTKIWEVSEKVGYLGVKHFSYVFKQHYNITPGEYQSNFSDCANS